MLRTTFVQKRIQFYARSLKKGFYIKPELIYSNFTMTEQYGYTYPYTQSAPQKVSYSNGAINLVFGKQHILGQIITIDYYFGVGYGFQDSSIEPSLSSWSQEYFQEYCYIHALTTGNFAYSGGLTIGLLF